MTITLTLERRDQRDRSPQFAGGAVVMTPPIDETYWAYRVRLTDRQAVVGFPKFGTIGIGFAAEQDWNTNLPYTCQTIDIVSHIWHNVIPEGVEPDEFGESPEHNIRINEVYQAVRLIQEAATADRPGRPGMNTQSSSLNIVFGRPVTL
jgi:hypothetical protein